MPTIPRPLTLALAAFLPAAWLSLIARGAPVGDPARGDAVVQEAATQGRTPWDEILRPAGEWPEPQERVWWRADLGQALDEARESQRPLFVTLRCVPCKQCASFDADLLEGGTDIDPLLARFVTVRLTDAAQMDLRILPAEGYQDLDLSWWGYFLSPDAQLYGVYGGRDHISDTTRISTAGLTRSLERVLDHHYDPRRENWRVDSPAPDLGGEAQTPLQLAGYRPWLENSEAWVRDQSCLHCHQVADVLRQPSLAQGTFDKQRDLDVWPLPENIGLELDRDHGLRVRAVTSDGPAGRAGVAVGDVLGAAQGQRLFGQADLRGVLHRAAHGATQLELVWLRGEDVHEGTVQLEEGWRRTVLDWRMSISQGIVGADPGFFPNRGPGTGQGRLSIRPWFGPKPRGVAYEAGLRGNHLLVAVDGESPDLSGRAFLVWFRQRYDRGDEVSLRVLEGGREREIRYRLR